MKVFYKKAGTFILLFCILLVGLNVLAMKEPFGTFLTKITNSGDYIQTGSEEIQPYIARVRQEDNTRKLITGDSLCFQMFNRLQEYNPEYTIVGSNGAITMAGQYLVVKEYLEHHENAEEVYMFIHPDSLVRTFDIQLGYQYLVMPFGAADMLTNLDANTKDALRSVYGSFFMNPGVIRWMDASPMCRKIYFNLLNDYGKSYAPQYQLEIANQYISKIDELCRQRGVEFYLYASPVSEHMEEKIRAREAEWEETRLAEIFPGYFKDILFFPQEQAADGTHFSGEFAKQQIYNQWIVKIFGDTGLLQDLKFE